MSYQSLEFILFSAAVLLLYYIVGKKFRCVVLAAANVVFYLFADAKYLPFIISTMLITFFGGLIIGSFYEKADAQLKNAADAAEKKQIRATAKKKSKKVLVCSIVLTVAILAVCKYTTFFVKNVNAVFAALNIEKIRMFDMILPLGISFYSFMALSYILDIYWKRYKAEHNFLLYAVWLSYFPHVVQGPIDRYNEFSAQIRDGVELKYENIKYGAQLAVWGFFKKLVIADRVGIFVDSVLGDWRSQDGIILIITFMIYSVQIYADFSGCIDMVSGISEMFGITMRKNFNHPYFSKTMAEFWRRWHISLQEWFKDYIYFPVSASSFTKKIKKSLKDKNHGYAEDIFVTCFPILVVWLITGIWHGAAWNFVAWGLYHAALLIGSKLFEPASQKLIKTFKIDTDNFGFRFWQMARTYMLCCIGRVFFRLAGIRNDLSVFARILTHTHPSAVFDCDFTSFGLNYADITVAVIAILILLVVDMLQEKYKLRETLSKQNLVFRWVLILAAVFAVIIFGIYGPGYDASSFIYEQF